jgi:hypothetical protein
MYGVPITADSNIFSCSGLHASHSFSFSSPHVLPVCPSHSLRQRRLLCLLPRCCLVVGLPSPLETGLHVCARAPLLLPSGEQALGLPSPLSIFTSEVPCVHPCEVLQIPVISLNSSVPCVVVMCCVAFLAGDLSPLGLPPPV